MKAPIRKHLFYEAVGMLFALVGAVLLIASLIPIVNPEKFRLAAGDAKASLSWYLITLPPPLLILGLSWYFNKKAQRDKKASHDASQPDPPFLSIVTIMLVVIWAIILPVSACTLLNVGQWTGLATITWMVLSCLFVDRSIPRLAYAITRRLTIRKQAKDDPPPRVWHSPNPETIGKTVREEMAPDNLTKVLIIRSPDGLYNVYLYRFNDSDMKEGRCNSVGWFRTAGPSITDDLQIASQIANDLLKDGKPAPQEEP